MLLLFYEGTYDFFSERSVACTLEYKVYMNKEIESKRKKETTPSEVISLSKVFFRNNKNFDGTLRNKRARAKMSSVPKQ